MDKKLLIIPITILFFIVVGTLAWFASNPICVLILNVLGGLFLFAVFCILPAFWLKRLLGKSLVVLTALVFIFWLAVFFIIGLKPEWGWGYVKFFGQYILPLLKTSR